jgi:hypothetical protein
MVIIGSAKHPNYGCLAHRYRRVCSDKLSIRHDRLENQSLEAIVKCGPRSDMLEYAISEFNKRLQLDSAKYLEDRRIALIEKPK